MFRGFTPWQKRVAGIGITGVALAVLGLIGPWLPVIVAGFGVSTGCILVLVLLGNRQNWRQLNSISREIEHQPTKVSKVQPSNTASHPLQIVPLGADYEYARRVAKNRSNLESFALRSKSIKIRDAFALAATGERFKFDDLVRFISVQRMSMLPTVRQRDLKDWEANALLVLARLQANQRTLESDLENSVRMFAFIQTFFGLKALKKNDRLIWIEALGELGRFEQQASLIRRFNTAQQFPVQEKLLELNSIRHTHGSTDPAWVSHMNAVYSRYGFSLIDMTRDEDKSPLDRLVTRSTPIFEGPLVTIIVPTFQGGHLLLSALASLLDQSWKNLEIIVVDDGSGPDYEPFLMQAEQLSDKIRVVRQKENLGAYCARNVGLSVAEGEYITVHDDDDWSHGDKIATQVQHLIGNPEIPGNMSAHVRVTEDLKFIRINNNPVLSQANFSSLMVHRSTFDKIGPWDTVNRGADSEFRDRLVKYYGQPVSVLNEVPLSFTRTWEGSLTSGEMSRGFVDPSRLLYLNAYTQAHEAAKDPEELLYSIGKRSFPVPTSMEPGARDKFIGTFDLVFMTDFRFPGGTTALTLREIEAAARAGLRIGFIQADSPLNGPQHPISSKLLSLQTRGQVTQLGLSDRAQVELLVIRHPSVVTFMDNVSSALTVEKSILIVNNPPVLVGGTGMVFDLPVCVANIDRIFDLHTFVVAESGVTKRLCESLVPADRLRSTTWPGLVSSREPYNPDFERAPVLGRHSRDNDLKWPSTKGEFLDAYVSSSYQTSILGGVETLKRKHGAGIVEGLTVYDFGEIQVQDFLDGVDFWAYFHDDKLIESFGMAIAEAMASGKVVILPPYLESTFGKGAVYAKPAEVESIILEYWNNPSKYLNQSEVAQLFVDENFSSDAFLKRVQILKDLT